MGGESTWTSAGSQRAEQKAKGGEMGLDEPQAAAELGFRLALADSHVATWASAVGFNAV